MKKIILYILGIILSVLGGGMIVCCTYGAITDKFQPIHVYLSLFFSFGVILAAGIVMTYLGYKKNVKSKESVDDYHTPVQMPDKKTVKILLQELQKRTCQDSIKIQIEENRKPTLFESKLGGVPYWDRKRKYPTTSGGSSLMLLAQINLNEVPDNQMLPKTGMLQFFIWYDRNYGLSMQESGYPNHTYQVVYHEKIDESITEADVLSMGIKTTRDLEKEDIHGNQYNGACFPVKGEYAVSFKMEKAYMNDCDIRCDGLLHKIADELGIALDSRLKVYQMFDEYDKKYADIHESTYGHRIFGYPYFRQSDPRSMKRNYYDTLLFQLDSDYWKNQWRILWGDAGAGAFFINSKKLGELDFSDVLYSWDCC